MQAKANKIVANLRAKLEAQASGDYRFITLTLKHSKRPLAEQIARLYQSFRKLRRMPEWKKTQRGGAAMLEVKWNPGTKCWHPHLHIIGEGTFIDKRDLSRAWKAATGDSSIIDIRRLNDAKETAHYVSKYVTKGTNGEVWSDDDAAQEWILASKGVRMASTYGSWRGYRLLQVTDDTTDWKPVTTMIELHAALSRYEEWAIALYQCLEAKRTAREKHKPPDQSLFHA